MGGGHQQIGDEVLLDGLHSLNSLAAAVLGFEIINGHTLDIAQIGHGNYGIVPGDHILHGNIILIIADAAPSVVTVFQGGYLDFLTDNTQQQLLICKDRLQLRDLCQQLLMLIFQLLSFQTCQSAQPHIYDGLRLCI